MSIATYILIALALGAAGFFNSSIWSQTKPKLTTAPTERMQLWKAVSLLVYLLVAATLTAYTIYTLWSPDPLKAPDTAGEPKCSSQDGSPFLASLDPDTVYVGSAVAEVRIRGCSFTNDLKVKVNGNDRANDYFDRSHLRVSLLPAEVGAQGTVVISLSKDSKDVASKLLQVVPGKVVWHFYGWGPWPLTQEVQFLILVLVAGAFGSSIYALKSFADYLGQAKLNEGWFTFYVVQPFEGAGIAFLLYLVIRGGLLAGTNADIKTVNLFGVCAIAGLAGAFSDTAFAKLREVFETLFKPKDDRGGKINPLKITTTALPDATTTAAYSQTLQASDGVPPLKWSVNPPLPPDLNLDSATGVITGKPRAVTAKRKYTFTVTDSNGKSATADIELGVPS